jgi:hypothetical protein
MAKMPRFAEAFAGRWPIVEMDNRDSDFILDLRSSTACYFKSAGDASCGPLPHCLSRCRQAICIRVATAGKNRRLHETASDNRRMVMLEDQ